MRGDKMKIGESIHGFIVKKESYVKEYDGTLYELKHIKSGAKLFIMQREDENMTFTIGFKTVPTDDTGVFHILEHSVLCGSARYKVKDPFVEMIKTSLQTFINAFTFPDKTLYPVSSRNKQDFENLMRIYMDAVFHPAIYEQPEIFMQEGWHFEKQEDGSYVRSGVVLNEMRGAYSSVNTLIENEMNKLLFPDNSYRFESGGHPDHVEELTYEHFISEHKKYYHPGNSVIFLDGNIDHDVTLKILDEEFLSAYDVQNISFDIPMQGPTGHNTVHSSYPVSRDNDISHATHYAYGYMIGSFDEVTKITACSLLDKYLAGDHDAPLMKAIIEKGLGMDVEVNTVDGIQQPYTTVCIRNAEEGKESEISSVCREVFENLSENGIDRERMNGLINNAEFRLREQQLWGLPKGICIFINMMSTLNFGGDPVIGLAYEKAIGEIRSKLDEGYFENLIREVFLENSDTACVIMSPDTEKAERSAEAERRRIENCIAAMSEEELKELDKNYERLCTYQKTSDTPEGLATLPRLDLKDVDRKPTKINQTVKGNTLLNDVKTNGITYASLYFPISDLKREELSKAALIGNLLTNLATEFHTAKELKDGIVSDLGKLKCEFAAFQNKDDAEKCKVFLVVRSSALDQKRGAMAKYIKEVLLHTRFDDTNRIHELVEQMIENQKQDFVAAGHMLAVNVAASGVSASGVVNNASGGIEFYKYLQTVKSDMPESFSSDLDELCKKIFVNNGLVVSIAGESAEAFADELHGLFSCGNDKPEYGIFAPDGIGRRCVGISADVAYAVKAVNMTEIGHKPDGSYNVLDQLLSLDYLWQKVRVQGGAYGTGIAYDKSTNGVFFYSYRDPKPANSLNVYNESASFIRDFVKHDMDLSGITIGAIAESDPLRTAEQASIYADKLYFLGISYNDLCREREQMCEVTPEKILALTDVLDRIAECENTCTVGGEKLIESELAKGASFERVS